MSLRDIVIVIWRRRWLIPLTCGMAVLAVWTVGRPAEPMDATYSGSINLTANEEETTTPASRGTDDPISFYSFVVAETPEIASRAAEDLGEGVYDGGVSTTDGLLDSMTVTELSEISTMTIALASQPSEEFALEALDRLGVHLIAYATELWLAEYDDRLETLAERETELRTTIAGLTTELDELSETTLTEEEQRAGVSPDLVKSAEREIALTSLAAVITEQEDLRSLSDEEKVPLVVSGPPAVVADPVAAQPLGFQSRIILATILGALLGVGLTFALHRFDTRLFSRKDAESAFDIPVLAEVPRIRWWRRRGYQLIAANDPGARASEAYRLLRSGIARLHRLRRGADGDALGDHGTVILVASASDRVGKSSTAANLAVAAVDAGQKALVVNADLRQPTIHRFFGVTSPLGLTDCVDEVEALGLDNVDLDRYLESTSVEGVSLLGSGHQVPNPGERLAASRPVIERLRERFDTIIIDSPPMLVGNDVNEVVPFVDLMLLVARVGSTTIEEAQWSRETAERIQAPVCGVALVGVTRGLQQRGAYGRSSLRRLLSGRSFLGWLRRRGQRSSAEPTVEAPARGNHDRDAAIEEPAVTGTQEGVSEEVVASTAEGASAVATTSSGGDPAVPVVPSGGLAVAAASSGGPDDPAPTLPTNGSDADVDPTTPFPLALWPAPMPIDADPAATEPVSEGSEPESDEDESTVIAAVPDISDILSDEDPEPDADQGDTVTDADQPAVVDAVATELASTATAEAEQAEPVDLELFDEDEVDDGVISAVWRSDRHSGTNGAAHG